MGGLEKITDSIVSKAELDAAEIIKKAEETAGEIIKSAESEMNKKRKQAEEKISEAVNRIMTMGQGNDRQAERQILLTAKSKIISEIIEEAKNKMKNMGKEEYTEVLFTLIKKYSEGKEGEILFSAKDKEFVDSKIKTLLEEEKLEISKECCKEECGFVIKYGKVEINCSYDSLFEEKYSELTDIVNTCISN